MRADLPNALEILKVKLGLTTSIGMARTLNSNGVLFFAAIVMACMSMGCSTTPTIPATELPAQFRAANRNADPEIDLTALARRSLNNDLIYPEDLLNITIHTGASEKVAEPIQTRVMPSGEIVVQPIGSVQVAGMTLNQAEEQIRRTALQRRIYRAPVVTVLIDSRQTDRVRVAGAVNKPGVYEIPRAGNDLLAAIVKAEGLTEDAGTLIEIRHPAKPTDGLTPASFDDVTGATDNSGQVVHVNLTEIMAGNPIDLGLQDGSVVSVKQHRAKRVYVQGLVQQAGEYEIPQDRPLRVDQAIALAGGRKLEFADRVHVTRIPAGTDTPLVIEVSLKEAKKNRDANIVLMPDDVVSVEETPTTFSIDFLRNFFRIGISSALPGF